MYVRTAANPVTREKLDQAFKNFQERALPQIRQGQGFDHLNVFLDRECGVMRVIAFYRAKADLDATREESVAIRARLWEALGMSSEPTPFEEYELALEEGHSSVARAA